MKAIYERKIITIKCFCVVHINNGRKVKEIEADFFCNTNKGSKERKKERKG